MSRNRVIYQSEALFASQKLSSQSTEALSETDIEQLHRVQSANYAFNISRTDVNQYGELAAIDRVVLETPTVSLDFSYYLANFANEEALGFQVSPKDDDDSLAVSAVAKIINKKADEKNYFIKTVGEGKDAISETGTPAAEGDSVIGIGNAFLTSYSVEAAVGSFPTVSVSAEGMNMRFDSLNSQGEGIIPSLDKIDGKASTTKYKLPDAVRSAGTHDSLAISTLRPGDIKISLVQSPKNWLVTHNDSFGDFSANDDPDVNDYDLPGVKLPTNTADVADANNVVTSANIQSFNISFDLSRTPIQRLGNRFAFAREIDFPVNITASFEAVLTDLTTGSLSELIDCEKAYDLKIDLYSPKGCQEDGSDSYPVCTYIVKDLKPDSQSFSSSIGDNKTVSIEFTSQIGGPNQKDVGLFMKGVTKEHIVPDLLPPTFEFTHIGADPSVGMEEKDVKITFTENVRGAGGATISTNDFKFEYNDDGGVDKAISSDSFDLFSISSDSKSIVLRANDETKALFTAGTVIKVNVVNGALEDYAGNPVLGDDSTEKERILQAPAITLLGDNPFTLDLGADYTDPGATAVDSEGNDITSSLVIAENTVNKDVAGDYTVTYTVVDSNGLSASVSRDVTVTDA